VQPAETVIRKEGRLKAIPYLGAANLAKLLVPAERDVERGKTRPGRDFLKEFKRAKKIRVDPTALKSRRNINNYIGM
jgi:hypothetical protein